MFLMGFPAVRAGYYFCDGRLLRFCGADPAGLTRGFFLQWNILVVPVALSQQRSPLGILQSDIPVAWFRCGRKPHLFHTSARWRRPKMPSPILCQTAFHFSEWEARRVGHPSHSTARSPHSNPVRGLAP